MAIVTVLICLIDSTELPVVDVTTPGPMCCGTVEARNTTLFRTIREIKSVLAYTYENLWASNVHHRIEQDLF